MASMPTSGLLTRRAPMLRRERAQLAGDAGLILAQNGIVDGDVPVLVEFDFTFNAAAGREFAGDVNGGLGVAQLKGQVGQSRADRSVREPRDPGFHLVAGFRLCGRQPHGDMLSGG
jgi:hypothetical protein